MSQAAKDRTRQDAEDFKSLESPAAQDTPAVAIAKECDKLREEQKRDKQVRHLARNNGEFASLIVGALCDNHATTAHGT
jgi:hypothetical protein